MLNDLDRLLHRLFINYFFTIMKNFYYLFLFFGFILGASGCSDKINSPAGGGVEEAFTKDSTWFYSITSYDSTSNASIVTFDTVTTSSTTIANNQKNLVLSDGVNFILSNSNSLRDTTGTPEWILTKVEPFAPCSLSVFPGNSGDTLMVIKDIPTKINGIVTSATLITTEKQTDVSVSVPVGIFSCSEYEVDIYESTNLLISKLFIYISASAGVVEREVYQRNWHTNSFYLAERYQLMKMQ
jgi:hypothetical protein